ncbi:MAG: HAD hydrolase-like protein [Candidatus Falkowbacteria bacterium]|nr:HAD hydrolase-like protein [Candidatus Falkowbacteria bacterium]
MDSLNYLTRLVRTDVDTIVFDYDGVIVKSPEESLKIIMQIANGYGCYPRLQDFREFSGMSWPEMFPLLGKKLRWSQKKIVSICEESTETALNTVFEVPSGLLNRVESLRALGLRTGILTGRTTFSLKTSARLSDIKIKRNFDFIGTADNLPHQKPAPAVWNDLQNKGCVNFISKVLFIGDTKIDLDTTKHKKFPVTFFGVGNRNEFPRYALPDNRFFEDSVSAVDFILACKQA